MSFFGQWAMRHGAAVALSLIAMAVHAQNRIAPAYDSDLTKRTKVLGVAVAAGARVEVFSRGLLMKVSKDNQIYVPTDAPLLSDAIFEGIKAELDLEGRYEVRRIAMEPAAARAYSEAVVSEMSRGSRVSGVWNKLLMPYYETCGCDALLVIGDGLAYNELVDAGASFGPSFSGRGGLAGMGAPEKAQFRVGLFFWLADPAKRDGVRQYNKSNIPDYSDDVGALWPGKDGTIAPPYWERMAEYLKRQTPLYQESLHYIGLRPSCALPYFEASATLQARGYAPPQLLEDTDPSRCVVAK
ncbi:hypothetical protein [Roseateles sp. BYS87W]|uniref:Uncharacterized protein n=1 Tax=Pelomonas baiyunensis TaxID=3299026 RepID=A0ABW7GVZ2_9BURK